MAEVTLTGEQVERLAGEVERGRVTPLRRPGESVVATIARTINEELAGAVDRAGGAVGGPDDGEGTGARARRRTLNGSLPGAWCGAPTGVAWVKADYLAQGGDPLADYAPVDDWREAPDIAAIANALIEAHPRFRHLRRKAIVYRWRREGGAVGGKDTLGKCVRVGGVNKVWSADDFLIWVAADHAEYYNLTAYQLEALVFHELCHASETEKGQPRIAPHDVTAFVAEVEEYGLWARDLDLFGRAAAKAVEQLRLWDDEGEGEGQ